MNPKQRRMAVRLAVAGVVLLPLAAMVRPSAPILAHASSCITVTQTSLTTSSIGILTTSTTSVVPTISCPSPTPIATPSPLPTPTPVSSPSPTPTSGGHSPKPTPKPTPSHASPPPPPPPGLTPLQRQQAAQRAKLIEEVRTKLGSDIASDLQIQDELTTSLTENVDQSAVLAKKVVKAELRIEQLNRQIAQLDGSREQIDQQIKAERAVLANLARQLYTQPDSMLVQIAMSTSVGQALANYTDLLSAANDAETLKAQLEAKSHLLETDRSRLKTDRQEEQLVRTELTSTLAQLATLQGTEQATSAALNSQLKGFNGELGSIDKQSPQLASQITNVLEQEQDTIIAEATQAVWDQVEALSASEGAAINQELPPSHGKYRFIWPETHPVITQPFGPTTNTMEPPYLNFPHFHTGIDLAEPIGSPVFAAADGVVVLVGSSIVGGVQVGYGNYVVIQHTDGFSTLYGHLLAPLVKVGQQVKQGQPIGLEGSTGNSTGPHVHFEVRLNGQFLDPTPFLPPFP